MDNVIKPPDDSTPPGGIRLEVTVHPGAEQRSLDGVYDLDLDRVPGQKGELRVLVTEEQLKELVARGYEVRRLKSYPVEPLDKSLIMDDETAVGAVERQLEGLRQKGEA
ncbi:MAG TPA: hypothetical protein VKK31_13040 [Thermoanaerobaculia bacterium]|nr:hypothetical protein [Thermoanaerobaculia bacterium]